MAGPELRLQCGGAIYEAVIGRGNELPYLLIVCCGDLETGGVVACPDLKLDYEASCGPVNIFKIGLYISHLILCRMVQRSYGPRSKHHR